MTTGSGCGPSTSAPRCRAARTARAGRVVFEVRDAVCEWNDGRWKLEGGVCDAHGAEPDLALDVAALGSAYLGGVSFTQLRGAAAVEELREGAVARADALFAWRPLPVVPRDLLSNLSHYDQFT